MRPLAALLIAVALTAAGPAAAVTVTAGQAEAREVARAANCTPTKLETVSYNPGRQGQTVFKVNCSEDKDAFVLVQCRGRTCALLR